MLLRHEFPPKFPHHMYHHASVTNNQVSGRSCPVLEFFFLAILFNVFHAWIRAVSEIAHGGWLSFLSLIWMAPYKAVFQGTAIWHRVGEGIIGVGGKIKPEGEAGTFEANAGDEQKVG